MDLVFPRNNEKKLVEMAEELGTKEVMLCYPITDANISNRKEEVAKLSGNVKTRFGILVEKQPEVQKAKHLTPDVVAISRPWVYDDKRVRFVINMEAGRREDFTHHRNSGLNQVFIKKAKQHGKTLLANVSLLYGKNQEKMLGRIMQNNRFYKKYKPDVHVVSGAKQPLEMRAPKDREAILLL